MANSLDMGPLVESSYRPRTLTTFEDLIVTPSSCIDIVRLVRALKKYVRVYLFGAKHIPYISAHSKYRVCA